MQSSQIPPLTLRLLGPFEVQLNGRPLPRLRSRTEQWLLALLALHHGHDVERAWLAGTLWPESEGSVALANLRRALNELRRALGPEAGRLRSPTARTLSLDLSGAEADVAAFDAAIARGDAAALEEAVALYRGPLLEGCVEEWAVPERQAREQAYLTALEALAAQARQAAHHGAAERWLRRAIAVDPLRESAQRALMETLATGGNPTAAIQVYQELRRLLHHDLNAEPAAESTSLFQQIRAEARERAKGEEQQRAKGEGRRAKEKDDTAPPESPPSPFALRPSPSPRLPQPLTRLVGREKDLQAIKELLASARLVTLTGPGGVGKTRLAIQVAEDVTGSLTHGAWFVDLTPLSEPALVPESVAAALELEETAGMSVMETLRQFLGAQQLLLVLDNCEHLVAACAKLAEALLQRCPNLRILATSREALGITGEIAWHVPSLSLPDPGEGLRVEGRGSRVEGERDRSLTLDPRPSTLLQYEAVRLFVERAVSVAPGFALDERTAPAVVETCRRLDGIPLAIELAAAWVKVFPIGQIAQRMDDPFRLLTRGSRTARPRQQTLRAMMDWSYDLLSDPERGLLRRLSVFAGGWTLEAAEAVCAFGASVECQVLSVKGELFNPTDSTLNTQHLILPLEQEDVLELLSRLVDKSLVVTEVYGEAGRYRLLETTREYAREHLAASGEEAMTRQRHAEYFLALAEESVPAMRGPGQVEWLRRLESVHDNLRAALEWLTRPPFTATSQEQSLRMVSALRWFWYIRSHLTEGRRWTTRALAGPPVRTLARASALCAAGYLAVFQWDHGAAKELLPESREIAEELGHMTGIADAMQSLGLLAFQEERFVEARALYERSLALSREAGDRWGIVRALNNLGRAVYKQGDHETARALHTECLAIQREIGNTLGVAASLNNLGELAGARGDYPEARRFYEECLAVDQELEHRSGIASSLLYLGDTHLAEGDRETARSLVRQSLTLHRDLGISGMITPCLRALARIVEAEAVDAKGPERAARLRGAAAAHAAVARAGPIPHQPDEEAFAAAYAEGRAMTLDQAVSYALEVAERV